MPYVKEERTTPLMSCLHCEHEWRPYKKSMDRNGCLPVLCPHCHNQAGRKPMPKRRREPSPAGNNSPTGKEGADGQ